MLKLTYFSSYERHTLSGQAWHACLETRIQEIDPISATSCDLAPPRNTRHLSLAATKWAVKSALAVFFLTPSSKGDIARGRGGWGMMVAVEEASANKRGGSTLTSASACYLISSPSPSHPRRRRRKLSSISRLLPRGGKEGKSLGRPWWWRRRRRCKPIPSPSLLRRRRDPPTARGAKVESVQKRQQSTQSNVLYSICTWRVAN